MLRLAVAGLALTLVTATPAFAQRSPGACGWFDLTNARSERGDRIDGMKIKSPADLASYTAKPLLINGGDFRGFDFSGMQLNDICFTNANFTGSKMRSVRARETEFVRSNFVDVDMRGAHLNSVQFQTTNFVRADFTNAVLERVSIIGGAWQSMRFDRAFLSHVRLSCTDISEPAQCGAGWTELPAGVQEGSGGLSFKGATIGNLAIATPRWFTGWGKSWDFSGTRVSGLQIGLGQVHNLVGARFAGPVWIGFDGEENGGPGRVRFGPSEMEGLLAAWRGKDSIFLQYRSPSFDCARATTAIEKLICEEDGGLGATDWQLADVYRDGLRAGVTNRAEQRLWLKGRDACSGTEKWEIESCVARHYRARIDTLLWRMSPPAWLEERRERLFLDVDLPVSPSFRTTDTYRRLLPLLVDTASSRVAVRPLPDGRIETSGDAVGGNGHMCSVTGPFTFNPVTRAYRIYDDYEHQWVEGPTLQGRWMKLEPEEEILPNMMCGARANFSDMRMIDAPASVFAHFRAN